MFPTDHPSQVYGDRFVINEEDVERLLANPVFMRNYREGVVLVAKSWGWDLETGISHKTPTREWTGYQVRLGKMIHSLTLLKQDDLKKSLINFLEEEEIIPSIKNNIEL